MREKHGNWAFGKHLAGDPAEFRIAAVIEAAHHDIGVTATASDVEQPYGRRVLIMRDLPDDRVDAVPGQKIAASYAVADMARLISGLNWAGDGVIRFTGERWQRAGYE